jgi:hypothetical protein
VGMENWDQEIERTVNYFKAAGYSKIVLLENYNLNSGITVIFDTSSEFTKLQSIPAETKK